jgi:ElaB/YqjD/DUF883 family membrane-anchored ribosome-binding protein
MANVRQRTHESVDRIMDKAENMRDSGQEKLDNMRAKATMMKENVDGYIQTNPEKSVLIAAGVGAVVGAMLTAVVMRKRD